MAKAGRYHVVRGVIGTLLVAVATFWGLMIRDQVVEQQKATYAAGLVDSLLKANVTRVDSVVSDLDDYREWTFKNPLGTTRDETWIK